MEDRAKEAVLNALEDDTVWAHLELQGDPLYSLIPAHRAPYYVTRSLQIGSEWAQPFAGHCVKELTQRLGIDVHYINSDPKVRAAYARGRITINRPALMRIEEKLRFLSISLDDIEAAAVAHEVFHYLESVRLGPVHTTSFSPILTFRLGRIWSKKGWIRACREIAAHSFAKVVSSVPNLPNAWDWLLAVIDNRCSWRRLALLTASQMR